MSVKADDDLGTSTTNVFALTDVRGLKWKKYTNPCLNCTSVSDDPILSAYTVALRNDVLCVWQRQPLGDTPESSDDVGCNLIVCNKELVIFWYGEEPQLNEIPGQHLKESESGHYDGGMLPEYEHLFYKAIHNLIQKNLLKSGFVRLGKWFTKPVQQPASPAAVPTNMDVNAAVTSKSLAFTFDFFIHGASLVVASVNIAQQESIRHIARRDVVSTVKKKVLLSPFGLNAQLTGAYLPDTNARTSNILEEWQKFLPIAQSASPQAVPGPKPPGGDLCPPVVEVTLGEIKMFYPSSLVVLPVDNAKASAGDGGQPQPTPAATPMATRPSTPALNSAATQPDVKQKAAVSADKKASTAPTQEDLDTHAAAMEGIRFKWSRGREECASDLGVGLASRVWQETEKKEVKKPTGGKAAGFSNSGYSPLDPIWDFKRYSRLHNCGCTTSSNATRSGIKQNVSQFGRQVTPMASSANSAQSSSVLSPGSSDNKCSAKSSGSSGTASSTQVGSFHSRMVHQSKELASKARELEQAAQTGRLSGRSTPSIMAAGGSGLALLSGRVTPNFLAQQPSQMTSIPGGPLAAPAAVKKEPLDSVSSTACESSSASKPQPLPSSAPTLSSSVLTLPGGKVDSTAVPDITGSTGSPSLPRIPNSSSGALGKEVDTGPLPLQQRPIPPSASKNSQSDDPPPISNSGRPLAFPHPTAPPQVPSTIGGPGGGGGGQHGTVSKHPASLPPFPSMVSPHGDTPVPLLHQVQQALQGPCFQSMQQQPGNHLEEKDLDQKPTHNRFYHIPKNLNTKLPKLPDNPLECRTFFHASLQRQLSDSRAIDSRQDGRFFADSAELKIERVFNQRMKRAGSPTLLSDFDYKKVKMEPLSPLREPAAGRGRKPGSGGNQLLSPDSMYPPVFSDEPGATKGPGFTSNSSTSKRKPAQRKKGNSQQGGSPGVDPTTGSPAPAKSNRGRKSSKSTAATPKTPSTPIIAESAFPYEQSMKFSALPSPPTPQLSSPPSARPNSIGGGSYMHSKDLMASVEDLDHLFDQSDEEDPLATGGAMSASKKSLLPVPSPLPAASITSSSPNATSSVATTAAATTNSTTTSLAPAPPTDPITAPPSVEDSKPLSSTEDSKHFQDTMPHMPGLSQDLQMFPTPPSSHEQPGSAQAMSPGAINPASNASNPPSIGSAGVSPEKLTSKELTSAVAGRESGDQHMLDEKPAQLKPPTLGVRQIYPLPSAARYVPVRLPSDAAAAPPGLHNYKYHMAWESSSRPPILSRYEGNTLLSQRRPSGHQRGSPTPFPPAVDPPKHLTLAVSCLSAVAAGNNAPATLMPAALATNTAGGAGAALPTQLTSAVGPTPAAGALSLAATQLSSLPGASLHAALDTGSGGSQNQMFSGGSMNSVAATASHNPPNSLLLGSLGPMNSSHTAAATGAAATSQQQSHPTSLPLISPLFQRQTSDLFQMPPPQFSTSTSSGFSPLPALKMADSQSLIIHLAISDSFLDWFSPPAEVPHSVAGLVKQRTRQSFASYQADAWSTDCDAVDDTDDYRDRSEARRSRDQHCFAGDHVHAADHAASQQKPSALNSSKGSANHLPGSGAGPLRPNTSLNIKQEPSAATIKSEPSSLLAEQKPYVVATNHRLAQMLLSGGVVGLFLDSHSSPVCSQHLKRTVDLYYTKNVLATADHRHRKRRRRLADAAVQFQLLQDLHDHLEKALQKPIRKTAWDTPSIDGPLNFQQLHDISSTKYSLQGLTSPSPLLVNHDGENVSVSPASLKNWMSLSIEPFAGQRHVAYLVIAPEVDFVMTYVKKFYKEVSAVYEAMNLGSHCPITKNLKDGIFRVGQKMISKLSSVTVDDWFTKEDTPMMAKMKVVAQFCKFQLMRYLSGLNTETLLLVNQQSPERSARARAGDSLKMKHPNAQASTNYQLASTMVSPTSTVFDEPPLDMSTLQMPNIVIYMIDPFQMHPHPSVPPMWSYAGLTKCFVDMVPSLPDQIKDNLFLQIVPLEQVIQSNLSTRSHDTNSSYAQDLKSLALSVYSKCRDNPLSSKFVDTDIKQLTSFGMASARQMMTRKRKGELNLPPRIYVPPYILHARRPLINDQDISSTGDLALVRSMNDANVLYCCYCLSSDREWLLATAADRTGELTDTCIVRVNYPSARPRCRPTPWAPAIRKMWKFLMNVISFSVASWRLVISRLGQVGCRELKALHDLITKEMAITVPSQQPLRSVSPLVDRCTPCMMDSDRMGRCVIQSVTVTTIQPQSKIKLVSRPPWHADSAMSGNSSAGCSNSTGSASADAHRDRQTDSAPSSADSAKAETPYDGNSGGAGTPNLADPASSVGGGDRGSGGGGVSSASTTGERAKRTAKDRLNPRDRDGWDATNSRIYITTAPKMDQAFARPYKLKTQGSTHGSASANTTRGDIDMMEADGIMASSSFDDADDADPLGVANILPLLPSPSETAAIFPTSLSSPQSSDVLSKSLATSPPNIIPSLMDSHMSPFQPISGTQQSKSGSPACTSYRSSPVLGSTDSVAEMLRSTLAVGYLLSGGGDHGPYVLQVELRCHASNNTEKSETHPLDSTKNHFEVLRHVLEQFDALSWLTLDPATGQRLSGLPVHAETLTHFKSVVDSMTAWEPPPPPSQWHK